MLKLQFLLICFLELLVKQLAMLSTVTAADARVGEVVDEVMKLNTKAMLPLSVSRLPGVASALVVVIVCTRVL